MDRNQAKEENAFEEARSLGDESKACYMLADILLNTGASSLILEAMFKCSLCRTGTKYFKLLLLFKH